VSGGGDVAEAEKKKVVVAPPAKAKVDVAPTKAKGAKAAKNGDILSAVRQATLSDTEAQALIDVLLLKQVGRAAHSLEEDGIRFSVVVDQHRFEIDADPDPTAF
jgi:hypothetical protein